jgi:hypothetical protein
MLHGRPPREFFSSVVSTYKTTGTPRVKVISVCHCQSFVDDYLQGISEIGEIAQIILKSAHRNTSEEDAIKKKYPIAPAHVNKQWLYDSRNTKQFIQEAVGTSQFLIFDIGGYGSIPLFI